MELPITPLQPVRNEAKSAHAGPTLFLKREDLLPFAGGNKVRRIVVWLKELPYHPPSDRTLAVLSNRGAHTFRVLTRMLEQGIQPIARLCFFECDAPRTRYSENIRRMYLPHANITVQNGRTLVMLLSFLRMRYRVGADTAVMGIGGTVRTKNPPYRKAFEECLEQLAEFGKATTRVWHLFPVASGHMADGFSRAIRERKLTNHRVIGVLTTPLLLRLCVRLIFAWNRDIVFARKKRLSWHQYQEAAARFFERTGVWLDPNHTVHAACLLDRLPVSVRNEDTVVFWITCPFIKREEVFPTNE